MNAFKTILPIVLFMGLVLLGMSLIGDWTFCPECGNLYWNL